MSEPTAPAPAASPLTPEERRLIAHATNDGSMTRNYYQAAENSPALERWTELVRRGHAEQLARRLDGAVAFRATDQGVATMTGMTPRLRMGHCGAEWLRKPMSPLGRTVADALGYVYRGLYHLPPGPLDRADWTNPSSISIIVPAWNFELSTWDSDLLTRLVVVCSDMMLRLDLQGANGQYVRLVFHQRWQREGGTAERIPTFEEHVAMIRKGYDVVPEAELLVELARKAADHSVTTNPETQAETGPTP